MNKKERKRTLINFITRLLNKIHNGMKLHWEIMNLYFNIIKFILRYIDINYLIF